MPVCFVESSHNPVRPRFRSLSLYNDAHGRLSFWYPADWHREEQEAPRTGVTLWPQTREPLTHIHLELQDLKAPLAAEDFVVLGTGAREGLAQLQDCTVRTWRTLTEEEPGEWGLQWSCTFRLDHALCVRQARMFVQRQYLYTITFQGASQAQFDYWKDMFEYIMLTVGTHRFSVPDWMAQRDVSVPD